VAQEVSFEAASRRLQPAGLGRYPVLVRDLSKRLAEQRLGVGQRLGRDPRRACALAQPLEREPEDVVSEPAAHERLGVRLERLGPDELLDEPADPTAGERLELPGREVAPGGELGQEILCLQARRWLGHPLRCPRRQSEFALARRGSKRRVPRDVCQSAADRRLVERAGSEELPNVVEERRGRLRRTFLVGHP
jgi:hypothetical protein